jgi:hypothetical protein
MHPDIVPFTRYVRLYTLHQIEGAGDLFLLRIRIETLRYSFAPVLSAPTTDLDTIYAHDPRAGAEQLQRAVLPRLQTLLDLRDPFPALGQGRAALWQRYAAERGLAVQPQRIPVIHSAGASTAPRLPARSRTSERLAQVQSGLESLQMAAETASALLTLWQNWQIGRAQRSLLELQRRLLHDAIQSQLQGQGRALDQAINPDFVRGYLSEHAGDAGYEALFDD